MGRVAYLRHGFRSSPGHHHHLARGYGAAAVWLLGSSADQRQQGRDLDLAMAGVGPARFYQFVGELMPSPSLI